MRVCRATVLAFVACVLMSPLPAFAESVEGIAEKPSPGSWPQRLYRWYYNPRFQPSWLGAEEARALVLEAAKQWEVCGVGMDFLGETDRPAGTMDGFNVVGWSLATPDKLRGITRGQARGGALLERDITFRPDREEFRRFPHLLRKVIMHEFGHAIGLTHSSRCDDVMTLAADCPRVHPDKLPLALTENDLVRCRALYGKELY